MFLFIILFFLAFAVLSLAVHVTVFIVKVALFGLVAAFAVGAILAALNHLTKQR